MKTIKKLMSVLLACLMLAGMLSVGVYAAAGTQDDPINANDKWFGYGADCYLLNPTIAAGSDGVWYTFSPEQDGILVMEHQYKNVDYDITIEVYDFIYTGGSVDGASWNRTIMTLPVSVGDPITIHVATKDGASGTVYASMKIVAGTADDPVKVKSADFVAYVDVGQTVYFQDDTLNADYATKGVELDACDTIFYTVTVNTSSGTVTQKAFTDTDGDGIIETKLGGSLGGSGTPAVKPMWAIEYTNSLGDGRQYEMALTDSAHECNWDDAMDTDCNTCGKEREVSAIAFNGGSISQDVNGLAMNFSVPVKGIELDGITVVYDNATIGGYKLIGMGAVVWNDGSETMYTLEDVNNATIIDVPVKYIFDLDENYAAFAIRIIHIPDNSKDTVTCFRSYFIYEDANGDLHTVYSASATGTYNMYVS